MQLSVVIQLALFLGWLAYIILHRGVVGNTVVLPSLDFELKINVEGLALPVVDVVGRSDGDSLGKEDCSTMADGFGDGVHKGELACEVLEGKAWGSHHGLSKYYNQIFG